MLTDKLIQDVEPIIEEIYYDDFIQGLIRGDIEKSSVIHYLQADALYLDEFAKIYAMLIAKADSRETVKYLLGQMEFLFDGESEAHETLARSVDMPYEEIIEAGEWYPSADHYIKHMYYNVYAKENIAFTFSAMAPCPYVYKKIAQMVLERNTFENDHPYRSWFEFYNDDMDDTVDVMFDIINRESGNMTQKDITVLRKNFIQSTEHEKRFFNMAAIKERWMEVGVNA
ncbi:thiaminase II [Salinicoccus halodurans]|uniref:Aminopyrimidine aminohydrolase n=1 Tax=Salinicoccus halodurans TaxID=407035 RepID=A0A0F7HNL1_9STAP|nr:thiaminase II [Salinicoccus halodurans]AKG74779.1 thiaminase [Salinicoccus halodurans]SFK70404.1 thiaminase (transcriptional activator TenA) [Salinicoccus halodurans]